MLSSSIILRFSLSIFSQFDYDISQKNPFGKYNQKAPEQIKDYQDLIVASRPELDTRLIPVGMIMSKILRDVIPNQIPFDELYEDSAPHGRANLYFLAGMVTYMAMYEENIPVNYMPSTLISPAIRNNIETIRNFVWEELNNFNFPNGDSRVFYN